jgi:hypothetical protein
MRFAPIFLVLTAPVGSAQTVAGPDSVGCAAARILTPSDAFTMPIAKTPEMLTMKGSVISTLPACGRAEPKPIVGKRIHIQPTPLNPDGLQLLPNPFTPLTK